MSQKTHHHRNVFLTTTIKPNDMAFESVPGLPGKVYTPEPTGSKTKKYHCTDCFCCQQCGEDRCALCRNHNCRLEPDTGIKREKTA